MESLATRDSMNLALCPLFRHVALYFFVTIFCFAGKPIPAAEPCLSTAKNPPGDRAIVPTVHRSANFLVHTDLPDEEAAALLGRLEATLRTISNYWRRPLRGKITCYVAREVDRWPDDALPHPQARVLLTRIGGATIARRVTGARNTTYPATVFALATPGIAEHEIVHAYCHQTFGEMGPDWYKEGMAEMAYFGRHGGADLQCPQALIDQLREGPYRTPMEVTTRLLTDSVAQAVADTAAGDASGRESVALWTPAHAETVKSVKQSYRWSWALCHLMANNSNYSARFRALGRGYVSGQDFKFQDAFGAMEQELCFEYRFMLEHMRPGYRVDLCRWDWSKQFQSPSGRERLTTRVSAAHGYQASGLRVTRGDTYAYRVTGAWSTVAGGEESDADGAPSGRGRLVGVIERDHQLTAPIELGSQGIFTAPADGKLHLRCRDDWCSLADNRGAVRVVFQRAAETR